MGWEGEGKKEEDGVSEEEMVRDVRPDGDRDSRVEKIQESRWVPARLFNFSCLDFCILCIYLVLLYLSLHKIIIKALHASRAFATATVAYCHRTLDCLFSISQQSTIMEARSTGTLLSFFRSTIISHVNCGFPANGVDSTLRRHSALLPCSEKYKRRDQSHERVWRWSVYVYVHVYIVQCCVAVQSKRSIVYNITNNGRTSDVILEPERGEEPEQERQDDIF